MQIVMIAGNVGRDAELRQTGGGDAVLGFSVAVDNGKDKNGNKRDATWWDCSIWGKRATALQGMITKGTKLTITGRPSAREHNGKVYMQCSVDQLAFQGGGQQGGGGYGDQQQGQQQGDGYGAGRDLGDDIPF